MGGYLIVELNSNTILNIINKNFDFEIVDTVLGKAIKMDAISAFNFSNVTGAGYLNNPIYPFTPNN